MESYFLGLLKGFNVVFYYETTCFYVKNGKIGIRNFNSNSIVFPKLTIANSQHKKIGIGNKKNYVRLPFF